MRRRAILVTIILLALVILPYVYAERSAGPEHVFGGFLFNPVDGNSYLAKMYQGWRGEWRSRLAYTAQPGEGAYLFVLYIFLGHLARLSGLSLILVFHLARVVGAILLMTALYHFLRALLFDERWLGWAFALAALGSGLGWLVFPTGALSSDFWVVEAYPFLSAHANPHFALGLALLLWLARPAGEGSPQVGLLGIIRKEWLSGAAALALALLSPFGVVVGLVALSGDLLSETVRTVAADPPLAEKPWIDKAGSAARCLLTGRAARIVARLLWICLAGAPVLIYDFWATRLDPTLASWNSQNLTPTPPLWDLLLALSPALILALPGAWLLWRRGNKGRLPLAWAVLGMLLIYLPFGLQRRFMMGLFVPVVGLAGFGLSGLAAKLGNRAGLAAVLSFALSLPTNILLLLVALHGVQTHDPLLYLARGEAQALAWIETNTPSDALILAAPQTGLFIPAHTGRRVIYGHPFETAFAESEQAAVAWFFQQGGQDLAAASAFLDQRSVDYVFYGPRERQLGALPDLGELQAAWSGDGVVIYRALKRQAMR